MKIICLFLEYLILGCFFFISAIAFFYNQDGYMKVYEGTRTLFKELTGVLSWELEYRKPILQQNRFG